MGRMISQVLTPSVPLSQVSAAPWVMPGTSRPLMSRGPLIPSRALNRLTLMPREIASSLSPGTGTADHPFSPDPRSLGSSTSRSASPSMLKPNTASEIASPGQTAIHGAWYMYVRPEPESIPPHDG